MSRALIVDDEANIRELVSLYLRSAGFTVDQAADGAGGLACAIGSPYDIVILDIMLPLLDGVEVCRQLRMHSDVPVIMLTARDSDAEKVRALEIGADDYITKPFSGPELVARVRAILRRMHPEESSPALNNGGLLLDPGTREVSVDGVPVPLTAKEFELLHALMRDPGIVLTRERMLDAAWGHSEYVDARGVDVHVRHIREKLGDDAAEPRFIETVRGVGYRLIRSAGL